VPIAKPVAIAERMEAAEQFEAANPTRITVSRVLAVTAAHFGTTAEALTADTTKWPTVRRRQVAMYVAHKLTGRSLPFIAKTVGRKDHTTVLHANRVIQGRIEAGDAETVEAVNAIVEKLTGGAHV
jgi:chromosomal replication initiator protein